MLVVPGQFGHVHIPKTGGQFLHGVLSKNWPSAKGIGGHATERPEYARDIPFFAVVREPVDWFISWYFYHKHTISDTDTVFEERGREHIDKSFPAFVEAVLESPGPGPLSEWVLRADADKLIRLEALSEELPPWLSVRSDVPEDFAEQLRITPPRNIGEFRPERLVCDERLSNLIRERERIVSNLY